MGITYDIGKDSIKISAEVKAIWKTGVEMEAMAAVTGALLNAYDMLKPLDDDIAFSEITLVKKKGGKSSFKDYFAEALNIGRACDLLIQPMPESEKTLREKS